MKYAIVGTSGYAINLMVFAVAIDAGGLNHTAAATLAFLVAVMNNFALNRCWTFPHSRGSASGQALRFTAASVAAFFGALAILNLLAASGVPAVAAQAVSIIVTAPVSFTINKIWSFRNAFD